MVIVLTPTERSKLETITRATTAPHAKVQGAQIVLRFAAGEALSQIARSLGLQRNVDRKWVKRFSEKRLAGRTNFPAPADRRLFPPEVALHIVKIACERPEVRGRSLSTWDCLEIARELVRSGVVSAISPDTVERVLAHHKLKPWRTKMQLSPKVPRDAAFVAQVRGICDLYTRPLAAHEVVLCVDEKTSVQPRPRLAPTTPTGPGKTVRIEHEYKRDAALNLLAAFNTRTVHVIGRCYDRLECSAGTPPRAPRGGRPLAPTRHRQVQF